MVPGESTGDLDAVHSRQPDVQQHHVGAKLVDQGKGDLAGGGVTNHLQVRVGLENLAGAVAVQGVVVDDHHPYHWRLHGQQVTRRRSQSLAENTHWRCVERPRDPPDAELRLRSSQRRPCDPFVRQRR